MFESRARIDLSAIVANWRMFARRAAPGQAAAVVKANGYGLGAGEVGRALRDGGCERFYVAWPQEGAQLRRAIGEGPEIAIFHGPSPDALGLFVQHRLEPVLNSPDQVKMWRDAGLTEHPYALHVDTGMNRLGVAPAQWSEAVAAAPAPNRLVSHLACADEPADPMNRRQRDLFRQASSLWPGSVRSLAATAGVYLGPDYTLDEVRPGIGLYGGGPLPAEGEAPQTVLTLTAPVIQVRNAKAGDLVGYGATWRADRDCTLATVALGYADGFLRAASNAGMAFVAGQKRPIVGRVSMDLIVIDVTGLNVSPGDDIEFVGPNIPLREAAASMNTIDYELLTRIGARVRRDWQGGR